MENSTGAATKSLYVQMSGYDTYHCSYFITVFNAHKLQKCNKPHSSQLSNYNYKSTHNYNWICYNTKLRDNIFPWFFIIAACIKSVNYDESGVSFVYVNHYNHVLI